MRVDIPNKDDPDCDEYHRRCDTVAEILTYDASELTGDDRDNVLYCVKFNNNEQHDFRWRNLRPTLE